MEPREIEILPRMEFVIGLEYISPNPRPKWLLVLEFIFYFVIAVFGIIFNSAVLYALRKKVQNLQINWEFSIIRPPFK